VHGRPEPYMVQGAIRIPKSKSVSLVSPHPEEADDDQKDR
jgi:hypothetical protein